MISIQYFIINMRRKVLERQERRVLENKVEVILEEENNKRANYPPLQYRAQVRTRTSQACLFMKKQR